MNSRTRTAADIHWELNLFYVAGGAPWRRVDFSDRPMLVLYLPSFRPQLRTWHDLERMNFWNPDRGDDDDLCGPAGWLEIEFTDRPGMTKPDRSLNLETIWRVAVRDGARFTVELVGCANGFNDLRGEMPAVFPMAASPTIRRRSREYWKGKAELYLVEEVPFGLVTVQVPRNSRDAVGQVLGRAKSLLRLGEPEHIIVRDFAAQQDQNLDPRLRSDGDLYVDLHYHGYYED